jgi:hypothetical protein
MKESNLSKLAENRDFLTTAEIATTFNVSAQTVRKHYFLHKHFYDLTPIKFGKKLLWKVTDIEAKLNLGEKL